MIAATRRRALGAIAAAGAATAIHATAEAAVDPQARKIVTQLRAEARPIAS